MIFNLLEKDIVPDFLIRMGIRNLLKQRLTEENKGSQEEKQLHLNAYIEKLKASPIAINTIDANEQHYEVPTEFYKYVLGKRMKYSGGLAAAHCLFRRVGWGKGKNAHDTKKVPKNSSKNCQFFNWKVPHTNKVQKLYLL